MPDLLLNINYSPLKGMRESRKFCQKVPNLATFFFVFFLVDEGREGPNTTISGPSSASQQNAI